MGDEIRENGKMLKLARPEPAQTGHLNF